MHYAAKMAREKVVEFLILNGAHVNARDAAGSTPLHRVARTQRIITPRGDPAGAMDLIRKSKEKGEVVAELLLDHGAEVDARDALGQTPLHRAAESDNRPVAELLVKRGADVAAQDKHLMTPLKYGTVTARELAKRAADAGAAPDA